MGESGGSHEATNCLCFASARLARLKIISASEGSLGFGMVHGISRRFGGRIEKKVEVELSGAWKLKLG